MLYMAIQTAKKAHAGQTRKDGVTPYIRHPLRVMSEAALLDDVPKHVLLAAVLHDVVEDTSVTLDEIRTVFGHQTAELVGELTNASVGSKARRAERKAADREKLSKASPWAKRLKMLDRIDNLSETVTGVNPDNLPDMDFAQLYASESELLLPVLADADEKLARKLAQCIRLVRRLTSYGS